MSNSPGTVNFHSDGTLIIVSGPSGAGKTTLVDRVCEYFHRLGHQLHFSVSHTTREKREGEQHGVNYYYVEKAEFEAMVARSEFLEWAHVHGHMYGTSRREVEQWLARKEDVILDIDVQGAELISQNRELKPRSVSVFVCPPTIDELERRLIARGQNTNEQIRTRVEKARGEIEKGLAFYDYIIINDDMGIAADCLKAAIIAKKLKTSRALERLREEALQFKEDQRGSFT
jgi:guanylate kinase